MRNALHEVARLVATLHDEEGRVPVEGFEAGALFTDALRAEAASPPLDEAAWYAEFGGSPFGDLAYTVRERTTLRPTIEVNGLWGGYTGEGGKTVTPGEAHAKLTMRLVPGQDPAAAQAAVRRISSAMPRPASRWNSTIARVARAPTRSAPGTRCAPPRRRCCAGRSGRSRRWCGLAARCRS